MREDLRALSSLRSSSALGRRLEAAATLAVMLTLGACRSGAGEGAPTPSASASEPAPIPSGGHLAALARTEAEQSLVAAGVVRAGLMMVAGAQGHRAYLALRRALAKGAPLFRQRAPMACDALLGPTRAAGAASAPVASLDAALARRDSAAALKHAEAIERTLRLLRNELTTGGAPVDASALALSDAAYDLGLRILEATPDAPADADAALADARGALEGIDEGAAALALDLGPGAAAAEGAVHAAAGLIRAGLASADEATGPRDRAALVVATGRLGAAIRRLAIAGGARVRLPYGARIPIAGNSADEPVSALTVPARPGGAERERPAAEERALAELGRRLFLDPRLSRGGARSCATCHAPRTWFADGLATPRSLDPKAPLLRNTPTLLYAALGAAGLWDGRSTTPEQQALHVLGNRGAMGFDPAELEAAVSSIDEVRAALAGPEAERVTHEQIAAALVAFESAALSPADAPIDRFARGEEGALSPDLRAGLDVFAGRGRCTRCHAPPLFGGSRPPDFVAPVFAALGAPSEPAAHAVDVDRGRALVTGRDADEGVFSTPSLRDVAKTAPYFHQGRFARLEDVVSFYDAGGGKGLGAGPPDRARDIRPLALGDEGRRVLLAFLREALLDGTPPERATAPRDAR